MEEDDLRGDLDWSYGLPADLDTFGLNFIGGDALSIDAAVKNDEKEVSLSPRPLQDHKLAALKAARRSPVETLMALPPSEHVDIFNADSVMKYFGPSADPAFVRNSIVAAAKYSPSIYNRLVFSVLLHLTSTTPAEHALLFMETVAARVGTFMGGLGLDPPPAEQVKRDMSYIVKSQGGQWQEAAKTIRERKREVRSSVLNMSGHTVVGTASGPASSITHNSDSTGNSGDDKHVLEALKKLTAVTLDNTRTLEALHRRGKKRQEAFEEKGDKLLRSTKKRLKKASRSLADKLKEADELLLALKKKAKVTKGDGGGVRGRHGSTIHDSEESGMSDLSDISSSDGETDGDF